VDAARIVAFSPLCVPEASLPLSLDLVSGGAPLQAVHERFLNANCRY
jgi:hypothetical protein